MANLLTFKNLRAEIPLVFVHAGKQCSMHVSLQAMAGLDQNDIFNWS